MAKSKGLLKGIATLLVAGILAGGVCAAGYASRDDNGGWFRESDLKAWTLKDKSKPTDTTAAPWGKVFDGDGNEMNNVATYAMPAAMAFYSDVTAISDTYANPTVTVTCSHNFEFNNVLVDWSVEYPSGASATDILTVTPDNDGSLTASISCSAPFDTQLTLKATTRDASQKTATCTIDYVKRIENFDCVKTNASDFDDDLGVQFFPTFGIGSTYGNLKLRDISYNISDDFIKDVKSYLKFNIQIKPYTTGNITLNNDGETNYYFDGEIATYKIFIDGFEDYDQAHKNAIYYAWNAAFTNGKYFQNHESIIYLNFTIDIMYNGTAIDSIYEYDNFGGSAFNYISGAYEGEDLAPNLTLNTNVGL